MIFFSIGFYSTVIFENMTIQRKLLKNSRRLLLTGKISYLRLIKCFKRNVQLLNKISSSHDLSPQRKDIKIKDGVTINLKSKAINIGLNRRSQIGPKTVQFELSSASHKHIGTLHHSNSDGRDDSTDDNKGKQLKQKILFSPAEEMTERRLSKFAIFEFVNKRSKAIFQCPPITSIQDR